MTRNKEILNSGNEQVNDFVYSSELVKKLYSIYQENKDLILMGGYTQGQNHEIDSALNNWNKICSHIKQHFKKKSSFYLSFLKSFFNISLSNERK